MLTETYQMCVMINDMTVHGPKSGTVPKKGSIVYARRDAYGTVVIEFKGITYSCINETDISSEIRVLECPVVKLVNG